MIFSFPIDAWLLLFVAVGLGLSLEIAFYRKHRGIAAAPDDSGASPEPSTDASSDGADA